MFIELWTDFPEMAPGKIQGVNAPFKKEKPTKPPTVFLNKSLLIH